MTSVTEVGIEPMWTHLDKNCLYPCKGVIFWYMKRLFSLSFCGVLFCLAAIVCLRVHIAYRILHCLFLCPPTDLPLLRAALTTSSMNVEDAEFYDNNLILLSMIIIY